MVKSKKKTTPQKKQQKKENNDNKNNTMGSKLQQQQQQQQSKKKKKNEATVMNEDKVTWEDITAMSDSDDDIGVTVYLNDKKAMSLRQAITDGKFDSLLTTLSKNNQESNEEEEDEEDFEEDVLDESSSSHSPSDNDDEKEQDPENKIDHDSDDDDDDDDDDGENEKDIDSDVDEEQKEDEKEKGQATNDDDDDEDDEKEQEEDDEDSNPEKQLSQGLKNDDNNKSNAKALAVVTAELTVTHSKLPWAETFVVVPPTPLPFGENGDPESNPLDVHDDLKREVAFYNTALEAVHQARSMCKKENIPFSRPDDFFAEMVKTDDHMAKVKDRLIFETKKIEAVAQRKSNKEQKLRARESQANRLAEKAKRKREHFQQVEDWANSVKKQRGSGGGALKDDSTMDEQFLSGGGRSNNNKGPNKKRQVADRKFGFGGKRGRFKQNDKQSLNDMSGFNHKGNFAGGMKRTASTGGSGGSGGSNNKKKNGSGASRQGKRARDAKRARR
ncbi:rRNA processing protein EBP2 [Nitzschia inconspicua]|uniref:rRNA processing protein EBP2 n=1 Tax=Nitzschia inconspicua TaxID=303405 RepID=A0A9K3LHF0_9STRA|nr:rRNA processing protein EBP2 [Nitzschia inconspicua]